MLGVKTVRAVRRGVRSAGEQIGSRIFKAVHKHNLIYNTCWEDPALDRVVLKLTPADRVLVITSAGCNALDYLLAGAGEVNAVDMNPIQNALLELKMQGIRQLDYNSFFEMFGTGATPRAPQMYRDALRPHLSKFARQYWDRHITFYVGKNWRNSFYFRGTSGLLAKLVMTNAMIVHRMRKPLQALLEAQTLEQQQAAYFEQIAPRFWTPWLKWFLGSSAALNMMGVPAPQREQIDRQYPGGLVKFIRDSLEAVCCHLPFHNNYFWRVYIQGHYTRECCPEYLTPAGFAQLKAGAIDGLRIHTGTVADVARKVPHGLTRFVLLDHMDWMSCKFPQGLVDEWNALLGSAAPNARAIFRSAGLKVDFLDHLRVERNGKPAVLGDLLTYHPQIAAELHQRDRVHTYGSFHIADLPG
jgi:S-adenosylmethionine-diacylglycerol 3-amino-3-carboxypropyl transferase